MLENRNRKKRLKRSARCVCMWCDRNAAMTEINNNGSLGCVISEREHEHTTLENACGACMFNIRSLRDSLDATHAVQHSPFSREYGVRSCHQYTLHCYSAIN